MVKVIIIFVVLMLFLIVIFPFLIQFEVKCNILKLKGSFSIKIFNLFKVEYKFRVKNGYVYVYYKNKERKEKISKKNLNLLFIYMTLNQVYFRQQVLNFNFISNFGYVNDSMITANICGYLDVLSKSLLGKLKNNKKSAHIFVDVNPKYNEDVFNVRLNTATRISVFDLIYSFFYTVFYFARYNLIKKLK